MPLINFFASRLPFLGWGDTWLRLPQILALILSFGSISGVIYLQAGLGHWSPSFIPWGRSLQLVVGFFFLPSTVEELIWRWLLISPDHVGKLNRRSMMSIAATTLVFTAAHPAAAWLFVPHASELFFRPSFIVIVSLLGLTCGTAFVLSKSIWPPVVIHWLTVFAWKFLLGGPFVFLGR